LPQDSRLAKIYTSSRKISSGGYSSRHSPLRITRSRLLHPVRPHEGLRDGSRQRGGTWSSRTALWCPSQSRRTFYLRVLFSGSSSITTTSHPLRRPRRRTPPRHLVDPLDLRHLREGPKGAPSRCDRNQGKPCLSTLISFFKTTFTILQVERNHNIIFV
jgi:hypothetical protein